MSASESARAKAPLGRSPFLLGFTVGAGALLAVVALFGLRELATVLMMLAMAFFIAVGLDRPVTTLTGHGFKRMWAIALVVGILVVVLCGGVLALLPALIEQTEAFFTAVPGFLEEFFDLGAVKGLDPDGGLAAELSSLFTPDRVAALATGVLTGVVSVAVAVFMAFTVAMLSLFILVSLHRITDGALRFVVASRRDRVRTLTAGALAKIGGYLVGAVGIAAVAGVTTFLYVLIAGIAYPLVLAFIVAVFDLIPQIGATIGATIVVLVALSESLTLALVTLAFFCLYQAVENWLVYPKVMGRAVQISSLGAVIAALLGGALFGVLGVLLGVPVYAAIQMIVREVVFPRQDAN